MTINEDQTQNKGIPKFAPTDFEGKTRWWHEENDRQYEEAVEKLKLMPTGPMKSRAHLVFSSFRLTGDIIGQFYTQLIPPLVASLLGEDPPPERDVPDYDSLSNLKFNELETIGHSRSLAKSVKALIALEPEDRELLIQLADAIQARPGLPPKHKAFLSRLFTVFKVNRTWSGQRRRTVMTQLGIIIDETLLAETE